jgi:hypothetical protein
VSIFYTLYTNIPSSIADIESLIEVDTIPDDVLNLSVHIPSERTLDIMKDAFPFRSTIKIIYHLITSNYDQSCRAMIKTVVQLLSADQSDLVLLYNGDVRTLQRIHSMLVLNNNGFWIPEYCDLLPFPYSIENLPGL